MAIGVLFEFPGVSAEQYEEVCRNLNNGELMTTLADWPNEGCLFHVAGPTEGGFRIVDVWESAEAFQRFGETLVPLLEKVAFPQVEPQIFPVHTFVK